MAGEDAGAKQTVMRLGVDIGFESVDGGPLKAARCLEPMGMFMISLGFVIGLGTSIGFKLVKS